MTAEVGGRSRWVNYSAPTSTSPWTSFTAKANGGPSETIKTSASSGSILVTQLFKGANNTFTVTGTNAAGCSYTSQKSTTVPASVVPDAPANLTVAAGDGRVTVTVAAPAAGGTPASYKVTAAGNATKTCTVAGASGSCDVTGLTNGAAYTFTATATNNAGTSAASGDSPSATPRGIPGKPGIGAVTATGGTTADVTFTAPSSDGGSPITSYTATSNPVGGTGNLSQAGSGTISVTGLAKGTAYTFTVTATNEAGTSSASTSSTSVTTFDVPGAPGIGAVTGTGNSTATVAFTAPTSDGGSPITSYTATSNPVGGTGNLSQAGSGTISVTGLKNGTAYTFTVTATNAAGNSIASAESTSVTNPYAVGDTGPGGGKVFYVSTAGFTMTGSPCGSACHYLEAQTADVSVMAWCDVTGLVPGISNQIGSGYSNTEAIANACTSGAGRAAWDSTSGGVSDWFLPSNQELKVLFKERASVGGLETGTSYLASTQYNGDGAFCPEIVWDMYVCHKVLPFSFKSRPVRAF